MASVRSHRSVSPSATAEPAWEIAKLFPDQGDLSEGDYLRLTDHTHRLAEFTAGRIEVLPMPTTEHQRIVLFLLDLLRAFTLPGMLGEALMAPLRIRLPDGKFREPDVLFLLAQNFSRLSNRYWEGADLVMEVISDEGAERDLVDKRDDYAAAGISEYWIVDPRNQQIIILRLDNGRYVTHSEATISGVVRSSLLPGLTADVGAVFAARR
jgi:Uma2 family endonuclease